jgi:hypothetical protein
LLLSTDEDDVELLKMSPFTTLLNDDERDDATMSAEADECGFSDRRRVLIRSSRR